MGKRGQLSNREYSEQGVKHHEARADHARQGQQKQHVGQPLEPPGDGVAARAQGKENGVGAQQKHQRRNHQHVVDDGGRRVRMARRVQQGHGGDEQARERAGDRQQLQQFLAQPHAVR